MAPGRFWGLMEERVEQTPDALVLVDEDMRTLTFAELWWEAELAAAGLRSAGVRAGDVVSWQMPNWIETVVLVAALSRLEVVQNPLSMSLPEHAVERLVGESGASLLVLPPSWRGRDLEDEATEIARRHGGLRVLVADHALPQGDPASLADGDSATLADGDAVRWLLPTAGTTGDPRLVAHTDESLATAARGLSLRLALIRHDRHGLMTPLSHVDGLVWLMASLISGCSNIITGSFDDVDTCEVLSREGVTLAGSTPAQHRAYVRFQRSQLQPVFPEVRGFPSAGVPYPPVLADEVRSLFDAPVLASYGSTEAPVLSTASPSDPRSQVGAGTPLPGVEVRIVDRHGSIVADGGEGEVRVRAGQLMAGHAALVDPDGFFPTGDVGQLNADGVLTVSGRLRDVIVRLGALVSPRRIEELLLQHDKIADAAVIGLPDADAGEQICAVVQVEPDEALTIGEVVEHLRGLGVDVEGLPDRLELVDALPRTHSGAVLRQALRDEFKG